MNKTDKAKEILDEAKAAGIKISLNNFGVVFEPPLPVARIYDAVMVGNELAAIVKDNPDYLL